MPITAVFEQQQKSCAAAVKPLELLETTTQPHARDQGPELLAHMEHFVKLVRRVRHPALLQSLLVLALVDTQVELTQTTGLLSIASRNAVFSAVARFPIAAQARLERAAERIVLLCDEAGVIAMSEVLDTALSATKGCAHGRDMPDDKFNLALWLYLQQEGPAPNADAPQARCFDHAEIRQEMLRQAQAGKGSSHFFGPRGVQPRLDDAKQAALRVGLVAHPGSVQPRPHDDAHCAE